MTELLQQIIAHLSALSDEEQDAYALALQAELDIDRRFAEAMDDPHDLVLDRLLAEAKADVAKGNVKDLSEL